jgi:Ca-activated chloride channel family protein
VVAPRYVPGTPLPGPSVGDGQVPDTDAVPDASRITPPVLLPGLPNPLRLSLEVQIDPAGLTLGEVRSSLHTVTTEGGHVSIAPGERADRDFILRLAYPPGGQSAVAVPDPDDAQTGTYQVTIVPPAADAARTPKDVVLLLDRSGSMGGWKMVAARRAAARVVDTLTGDDRFAVLTFDHQADRPAGLDEGLVPASAGNRYRAVEHLSRVTARGGTELLAPLRIGLELLRDPARDRVLVLVTDGQVGNEDQILHEVAALIGATRVHTVGIDRAVNAGFLGRLAAVGGGRAELVESEDRLDEAMAAIHRRIGAPVVTDLAIAADGLTLADDTRSPHRLPGLYPGVPLVVGGRYSGAPGGTVTVTGRTGDDGGFRVTVPVTRRDDPAVTAQWARARLRDLEDRYAAGDHTLERSIVDTSLRFGVLCRFTAYLAVDSRVVNEGGATRRVTQPVELPSGWAAPAGEPAPAMMFVAGSAAPPPMAPPMRQGFAPVSARGRYSRAQAADTALTADGGTPPRTFLPPRPERAAPALDLADVARLEADRLRDARDRPTVERRILLEDLAARLTVLLAGRTGDDVAPLRRLLATLTGSGDLDTRWAEALRVLGEFGAPARDRGQFWKR